jgi:hypothetical protein
MPDADRAKGYVEAAMSYIVDTGTKPVSATDGAGKQTHTHTGTYEDQKVRITNARRASGDFSLDREGYRLVSHDTKVEDFYDEDEVRTVYYAELDKLVKAETGCTRTFIFDHTRRAADEDIRAEREISGPVRHVHNDYTNWSGPERVRDLLGDEAEELLKHRFQVIQVWRSTRGPVMTSPLAIIDARSIAPADLIPTERRYPDRTGEIYHIVHNPEHHWVYYPEMARNEALVFKCYDSRADVARFTAHSAFQDPTSPAGAPPRESMEARILAFFDPEDAA